MEVAVEAEKEGTAHCGGDGMSSEGRLRARVYTPFSQSGLQRSVGTGAESEAGACRRVLAAKRERARDAGAERGEEGRRTRGRCPSCRSC